VQRAQEQRRADTFALAALLFALLILFWVVWKPASDRLEVFQLVYSEIAKGFPKCGVPLLRSFTETRYGLASRAFSTIFMQIASKTPNGMFIAIRIRGG
jgi:hypothetical protein